jgi:hypothetical protein
VVSWCHQDDGDAEDYGGRRPAGGARADHPHRRAGEHRPHARLARRGQEHARLHLRRAPVSGHPPRSLLKSLVFASVHALLPSRQLLTPFLCPRMLLNFFHHLLENEILYFVLRWRRAGTCGSCASSGSSCGG